jgi:hypothetical protein
MDVARETCAQTGRKRGGSCDEFGGEESVSASEVKETLGDAAALNVASRKGVAMIRSKMEEIGIPIALKKMR